VKAGCCCDRGGGRAQRGPPGSSAKGRGWSVSAASETDQRACDGDDGQASIAGGSMLWVWRSRRGSAACWLTGAGTSRRLVRHVDRKGQAPWSAEEREPWAPLSVLDPASRRPAARRRRRSALRGGGLPGAHVSARRRCAPGCGPPEAVRDFGQAVPSVGEGRGHRPSGAWSRAGAQAPMSCSAGLSRAQQDLAGLSRTRRPWWPLVRERPRGIPDR